MSNVEFALFPADSALSDDRVTIEERGRNMPTASSSITWSHDFDSALARARDSKRGILLDFTAAPM